MEPKDNKTPSRILKIKFQDNDFEITFPNVGQIIDIETRKTLFSSGQYENLRKNDSIALPAKQNANIQSWSAGNVIWIINCRIEKIIGLGGQVDMRGEFVFQTYLWRNNHGAVNLVNGYIGIII